MNICFVWIVPSYQRTTVRLSLKSSAHLSINYLNYSSHNISYTSDIKLVKWEGMGLFPSLFLSVLICFTAERNRNRKRPDCTWYYLIVFSFTRYIFYVIHKVGNVWTTWAYFKIAKPKVLLITSCGRLLWNTIWDLSLFGLVWFWKVVPVQTFWISCTFWNFLSSF